MEKSKKYVLVPEERLQHFAEDHLSDLDKQLHAILIQKGLTDHEKSSLYLQTLQKFVKFPLPVIQPENPVEKESPPETISSIKAESPTEETDIEKDVLSTVPRNNKKLAHDMLKFLRDHRDSVSWTPQKHVVVKGHVIPNSNIVNLINFVLRSRRKGPRGHSLFVNMLKELNVPDDFIRNPYLKNVKKEKPVLYARPRVKSYTWKSL